MGYIDMQLAFDADDLNDLAGMLSGEIETDNQLWTN